MTSYISGLTNYFNRATSGLRNFQPSFWIARTIDGFTKNMTDGTTRNALLAFSECYATREFIQAQGLMAGRFPYEIRPPYIQPFSGLSIWWCANRLSALIPANSEPKLDRTNQCMLEIAKEQFYNRDRCILPYMEETSAVKVEPSFPVLAKMVEVQKQQAIRFCSWHAGFNPEQKNGTALWPDSADKIAYQNAKQLLNSCKSMHLQYFEHLEESASNLLLRAGNVSSEILKQCEQQLIAWEKENPVAFSLTVSTISSSVVLSLSRFVFGSVYPALPFVALAGALVGSTALEQRDKQRQLPQ